MDAISSLSGLSGYSYSSGSGTSGTSTTTSGTSASSGTDTASAISDKQLFGAQVVTATLDTLNSGTGTGNADYDFQKKVLSTMGLGSNLNTSA